MRQHYCVLFRLILYRALDLPPDRPYVPVTVCWKLMISVSRHYTDTHIHTGRQTDRHRETHRKRGRARVRDRCFWQEMIHLYLKVIMVLHSLVLRPGNIDLAAAFNQLPARVDRVDVGGLAGRRP